MLIAYVAHHDRVSLLDIDRVGLDYNLIFSVAVAFAAGGACAVCDLHQLQGVALVVLLEGDGGHLAKGVVDGHHNLLPDRIPCRRLCAEQPLAATRPAADAAAGQAQGSQSDEDSR